MRSALTATPSIIVTIVMNGAVLNRLSRAIPKIVPPIVGTNALHVVSRKVKDNKRAAFVVVGG
jgi:hypothetical protein